MMVSAITLSRRSGRGPDIMPLLVLLVGLGLALLSLGCTPGGDSGPPTAPTAPSPQTEAQAIKNLLQSYREAMLAEDIDRLQAHLAPASAPEAPLPQDSSGAFADLAAFRQALSDTFVTRTVTAVDIPEEQVVLAPGRDRVTFLETDVITGVG